MTTTTAPAGTGASATSPTASSSATETPASVPSQQTSQQRIASLISKQRAPAAPTPAAGSPPADSAPHGDSPDVSTGAESLADGDETKQDSKKKSDDVVPMAAFKARIGKLNENLRTTREELARESTEREKATAAARLLHEQNEALRAQLREGRAYDPRDEELADVRLSQAAKERAEAIAAAHEARLQEMHDRFEREAAKEALKATLSTQIETATSKYSLASREAVIAVMRSRDDITANEAARLVHEKEAKRLEALGYAPRQATAPAPSSAPVGVRAPGSGGSETGRFANNSRGIEEFLRARKQ